ncbi:MAG: ADP-ribosylglycohydrolase family protein [Ignavibacteriales bacterium]|nr:MAG: ADP-ribosylglycohydrolase family protein [Ignavibacteriales bacterium]
MLTKNDLLKDKTLLQDRARASLVGHAIGDSFGDIARSPDYHFQYGITMDFSEKPAPGTDDTEFALLTAQTLIKAKGNLTDADVLESWRTHVLPLTELKRGGASEREAAANIRRGVLPPFSGIYNSHYMSDGAAMRVTPIGIACAGDPKRAAHLAGIEASISHSRDGLWGAQAVAVAIALAMAGASVEEIIQNAINVTPKDSWIRFTFEKAFSIIEEKKTLEDSWKSLHDALWTEYKAVSPEAVVSAFSIFKLTDGDFKRGIIYSGNFGRDADTISAIVGALSGAMSGIKSIPSVWVDKVRITTGVCLPFTKGIDLFDVASQLADLVK